MGRINTIGSMNLVVPEVGQVSSCAFDSTMLWHQRMGQINENNIQARHGKGMVEGMTDYFEEIDFCEHCVYGKQSQVKFPSKTMRVNGFLEVVHSDVFGPVSVPSLGGSLYYVSFIDDFSRMTWLYFLKKKFEVFERFQEFKALVENQFDRKVKVLRIDNGGEFCGKVFDHLYRQHDINRHNTTPYTPQQNEVVERMNITLMDKARSMLSGAGLSQELWVEAIDTVCYLVNRSSTTALVDKTPYEAWDSRRPSLAHLKVFGCDAFMHVPKEKGSKLDVKLEKCIFIGYKDGVKGYKLWNLVEGKIVYS